MHASVAVAVGAFDDIATPLDEYPHALPLVDCIREATVDAIAPVAERVSHGSLARCPMDPSSRRFLRFRRFGGTSPRAESARVGQFPSPPRKPHLRCGCAVRRLPRRGTEYRCRR